MQLVIRIPYGGNIGAIEQHSESPETYYAHTAGLKVVTPSTPSDAYALLTAAIRDPDPVIFLEPKARYWQQEDIDLPLPPASARSRTRRPHGQRRHHHRLWPDGADSAGRRRDRRDPKASRWRSLTCAASRRSTWIRVSASVRKTRRAVVVHEAPVFMGMGAEIAARLMHDLFDTLAAPVERVGSATVPYPPARFEKLFLPDADRILEAVDRTREY